MVILNEVHFRILESFLYHMKASGGETKSDDILGEFISSLTFGIEGPVTSAIKILRTLKDLEMALYALWEAVENGLSKAQKELLPVTRHHGILSLPLEIVEQIFRQVYDDDADCATESIPLVNRYFRDIAVGTPELWTYLTPSRNPRLYMERSKSLGLKVDLSTESGGHYRRFLDMVAPQAERWTSLSIPSHRRPDNYVIYVRLARNILSGKTFTALRELRIEGPDNYYGSLWDLDDLYRGWKMPSLRIIKSNNVFRYIQSASLVCYHLHVGDPDLFRSSREEINLNGITKFLQSVPSLTELSLDIGWFDKVEFHAGTEATLPTVKTLRLRVKAGGAAYSSFTDFLASLRTPNLSNLSVDVATSFASLFTSWISVFFLRGDSFWPSLESLDLSISYVRRDYDGDDQAWVESIPDDLLERIPAVRHLSIRAVDVDSTDPADWNVPLAHLRTLCFRDCNKFDTRFILGIRRIFEAPGFETLKIHNCKKIDTEAVRKMMPEGKMFVSTVNWNEDISVL